MAVVAVILNYRNATDTLACVRSLSEQQLKGVVILDNSNCALSTTELREGLAAIGTSFLGWKLDVIVAPVNLGFAKGVNTALQAPMIAAADQVLLINNDAIAMPGMVDSMRRCMEMHGARVVSPHILDTQGQMQPILWYHRFFGLTTVSALPGAFPFPSGCCLLVQKPSDGVLFDEAFFMYGEDVLLGWQLRCEPGSTWMICDAAKVVHQGRGTSSKHPLFYEYHTARAHVLLNNKTYRTRIERLLLLMTKATGLLIRALWRALNQHSIVPLQAYFMAWRKHDVRPQNDG